MNARRTSDQSIPRKIQIYWSIGALGVAFLLNVIAGFALFYMISVLKIDPFVSGTVIFVAKIFDVFTDPVIGSWSDRLKSNGSRRRPFLLAGAIISAASFLMIFTTPQFSSESLTIGYVFLGLILYAVGYTIFNIPYMAMPAEMTDSYHDRSSIHGFRVVMVNVGGLIAGAAIPSILEELGRTSWDAYAAIGVGGAIIIFASMMLAWAGTASARFTVASATTTPVLSELGHVFRNGHFIRLLLVKATQLFGVAATIAAFSFFVLNVMQRDFNTLSYYFVVVSAVSIVVTPMLVKLSKRIGKSRTYIVSASCYVLVVASWTLAGPGEPLWAVLLRAAILGIAVSGNVVMAMSMLTDIINYDAGKCGVRREGVFTSFYSFVEKFTFAFGPLVVGAALSISGFDEALPPESLQTPAIRQALLLGVSYIPAAMGVLSIFLLAGYKLTAEDIEARPADGVVDDESYAELS